jgi:hypothetical protein
MGFRVSIRYVPKKSESCFVTPVLERQGNELKPIGTGFVSIVIPAKAGIHDPIPFNDLSFPIKAIERFHRNDFFGCAPLNKKQSSRIIPDPHTDPSIEDCISR